MLARLLPPQTRFHPQYTMKHLLLAIQFLVLQFLCISAQASLDASVCIPGSGISAFPNCNYLERQNTFCNTKPAGVERLDCLCTQQIFSAVVEYVKAHAITPFVEELVLMSLGKVRKRIATLLR
jgi:hypothetical protein